MPETAQDGDDTWRHGRAPSGPGWLGSPTKFPEAPPVLKTLQIVQKAEFVRSFCGIRVRAEKVSAEQKRCQERMALA